MIFRSFLGYFPGTGVKIYFWPHHAGNFFPTLTSDHRQFDNTAIVVISKGAPNHTQFPVGKHPRPLRRCAWSIAPNYRVNIAKPLTDRPREERTKRCSCLGCRYSAAPNLQFRHTGRNIEPANSMKGHAMQRPPVIP